MREDIAGLFPELELITAQDLREKVVNVWEEAIKLGGWTLDDLKTMPFTLLIPDVRVNLVDHTCAVTQVAVECAKVMAKYYQREYEIDLDVLVAGALLHDVGKLLEYERAGSGFRKSERGRLLRHPFSGAGLATKHGLPDKVVHLIASHAKEGEGGYRCPEAVILHHSDFMNFEPLRG